MYKRYIKRLIDVVVAVVTLVLTGWLLLVVAVFLHFANKGAGAFFLQERPGKDAKIFRIIKFKTMTDERDAEGNLLPDAQRLTKVGRFVRATSLDELPQLLNVLKGDMSLVGPRPLLVQYLPLYSPEQARRHEVRPGITGWAQVHGRNAITWQEKFKLDVWYVNHCTLATDLKVVGLTIVNVLKRKDINSTTSATMEYFTGND
jgi:lipopolysaccharide/colanic/teichoic acid biosynthesis glycosyltransferase